MGAVRAHLHAGTCLYEVSPIKTTARYHRDVHRWSLEKYLFSTVEQGDEEQKKRQLAPYMEQNPISIVATWSKHRRMRGFFHSLD